MENSKHVALRALIRPSPSGQGDDNLFVRLSPHTAKQLHDRAINAPTSENGHRQSDGPSSWLDVLASRASALVEPTTAYDDIEFIPLKITINSEIVYASYNGGSLNMIEYNLPQGPYL
jgi:hypothetical protein